MRWHVVFLLLAVSVLPVKTDLSKVVAVQNFNLKTDVTTDITCSSIKKILMQGITLTNYTCIGETLSSAKNSGMFIIIQMQPMTTPSTNILTWTIEYSGGNLTSSFSVENVLDMPLFATNIVQISGSKDPAVLPVTNGNQTTTELPKTTEKPAEPTTKEAPTTQKAPTLVNVTVTVGYLQFQTGQAPMYVNKNTQAVVFAVIEGILLGAILLVFIFRWYKRSKLRAAGLYPTRDIHLPNPARNSVYYDNGGTLSYPNSNTRPEIPSYRSPDTQPPLRLDSLSPRPQQPVISPNLVPVTTTQPRPVAATTVTPAPLNYWPDQPQPIKNIMDSDI